MSAHHLNMALFALARRHETAESMEDPALSTRESNGRCRAQRTPSNPNIPGSASVLSPTLRYNAPR